ncbi:MAG: hypothetical protein E7214_15565 [Clostridium sp.]|nr:hypothetical protein [Clostridium sp.]
MKERSKELALISENMGLLYEDGIELNTILDLLLELPLSKRYKSSIKEIKVDISRGLTLGDAFNKYKDLYPDFFIGVITLGESSGEITKCLKSLSDYYSNIYSLKRKISSSLVYPIFVLSSLVFFMMFSFFCIIPNLYEAFSNINDGGKMIKNIYSLNRWVISNPVLTIIFIISWGACFGLIIYFIKERKKTINILLNFGIVKRYYEYIFISIFSVIINSGNDLISSMDMCIKSSSIGIIKDEFEGINKEILKGNDISYGIKQSKIISKYTYSMIVLGEKGGSISEVVSKVEGRLRKDVMEKVNRYVGYITPISIGILAVFILLFLIIFIIPMLDMMYTGIM